LLDEVVEPEVLHERAFALAAEIAKGATVASALVKQAVDTGLNMPLAGGLAGEKDLFVEVFKTNDSQRGVKSFLENGPGKAVFEGN
jgi:enoyl-CoA hydratase